VQSSQRLGDKRMRRHARAALGEGVRARVRGVDARVINCSASGALLRGPIDVREAETIDVDLRLPARNLTLRARVIRHERTPQGVMTALHFEAPPKDAAALLARTVDVAAHTPQKLAEPLVVLFDPREGPAAQVLACARELGCQTEARRTLEACLALISGTPFRVYALVVARDAPADEVSRLFEAATGFCPVARKIVHSDNSWMSAAEVQRLGAQAVVRELNLRTDLSAQLSEARWRDAARASAR
jgi:PilZ domain